MKDALLLVEDAQQMRTAESTRAEKLSLKLKETLAELEITKAKMVSWSEKLVSPSPMEDHSVCAGKLTKARVI